MTNWAVGSNMAGYLPESDVFITSDFEQARQCLLDDLAQEADNLAEVADFVGASGGDADAAKAAEEAIAELKAYPTDNPFLAYVDGIAYWIDETQEAVTEDE